VTVDETTRPATTSLDAQQILDLLPHRYPFLLVDRIERICGDESCVGVKNISFNEPFFQGHFPGRPLMPGVLLIEGMAQTAGAICRLAMGQDRPHQVYFLTIDRAKFRRPVVPGDRVEYHMSKLRHRGTIWWYSGKATVDGKVVCEAEVGAMMSTK
jgi:3-hydroxyacyl-[acyl-carrier-protein] dehydratase